MKIHEIKFNVGAHFSVRDEFHDGRRHLVVPIIMMVEGVHSGSDGAKLYLKEEYSSNIQAWNGMPVPIIHPTDSNGNPISCNAPETIERYNAGRLYNVIVDDQGRLKAEAWLDIDKANKIHPGIIEDLRFQRINMDVSTGLYSNDENIVGVWEDKEYSGIVRHIIPDHLALLPGQEGACSWEDGCGVRLNNKGGDKLMTKIIDAEGAKITSQEILANINDPEKSGWVKRGLVSLASYFGTRLTENEISDEDIRGQLQRKIDDLDRPGEPRPGAYHYVVGVYTNENYFVYESRVEGQIDKLFKQDFEIKNEVAVPKGIPVVVEEQRQFVAAAGDNGGAQINNKIKINKETKQMSERQKKVDTLIANEASIFQEDVRETLMELDDKSFDAMVVLDEKITAANQKAADDIKSAAKESEKKVKDNEKKLEKEEPVTAEAFISNAPGEIGAMLQEGLTMRDQRKTELIASLTSNENCPFTEDQLKIKDISELSQLVNLAGLNIPKMDFSGQGGNISAQAFKRNEKTAEGNGIPDMPNMIASMEEKVSKK